MDIFQGNWQEVKGKMKQAWGKFTDDDLKRIEGNQEEIFGLLQKHYGYGREQAQREIERFKGTLH